MTASRPELTKEIRKRLRQMVPPQAFDATPVKLLWVPFYLALVVLCCLTIRRSSNVALLTLCGLLIGHAHLCLGFLGHDFSHGTILRGKWRYLMGVVVFTPAFTSATMWNVNHVETHHQQTNARPDSFRYFARDERAWHRTLYALLFMPNRYLPWNPLQGMTYFVLNITNTLFALFGVSSRELAFITGFRRYTPSERLRVGFEVAVMIAYRVGLVMLAGGYSTKYLWAGTIPTLVGTFITSAYLHTQHTAYPLGEEDDPLATTSVRMPKWVDFLHFNVSHHTAHHLFEGMNTSYYPLVTSLLAQHYPDALDRKSMFEALALAQRNELYREPPEDMELESLPTLVANA